LLKELK